MKVAIKVFDTIKYKRSRQKNGISENTALKLCRNSPNISRIVEKIQHGSKTYIVTQFVKGGDLLAYLEAKGV